MSENKNQEKKDVWRPDAYICNECGHRFSRATFVMEEGEDGIVFQRTICPNCKSDNIRLSSWSEKDYIKTEKEEKITEDVK
jgi:hypothetical protein